jgi:hypothetical protein
MYNTEPDETELLGPLEAAGDLGAIVGSGIVDASVVDQAGDNEPVDDALDDQSLGIELVNDLVVDQAPATEPVSNAETGQACDAELTAGAMVDQDVEPRNETVAAPPTVLVVRTSKAETETPPAPAMDEHAQVAVCPSCRIRIQVSKVEESISYLCRACQKPMHLEVTCAACSSTIEITQDELHNFRDNGLRCPVCLETVSA